MDNIVYYFLFVIYNINWGKHVLILHQKITLQIITIINMYKDLYTNKHTNIYHITIWYTNINTNTHILIKIHSYICNCILVC